MVAHALLLAPGRLRRMALRPLGGGAMHHRGGLPLCLMLVLLVLMLFVLVVPVIVPALVPLLGLVTVRRVLLRLMPGLRP